MNEAERILGNKIQYCKDQYEALDGASCLLLVTEWKEFRVPEIKRMKEMMETPAIFDGRNIYERREMEEAGFDYFSIGK
jgi:UDPglucose 6-dehydrogenase